MHQGVRLAWALSALSSVWFFGPSSAHAGLGACGDIHVEAEAMCELVPPGASCEGMCTPISVRAACAAELSASCAAECDELPSVSCTGSCQADCSAQCEKLEPGEFDCAADCRAQCSGDCQAQCEGSEDGAACQAQCEGACGASCDAHCDVELPEADCEAGCEASCEGSCEADANLDCQLECQSMGFAECQAELEGGCEIECQGQKGALFCDGQYIDHGDNLQQCIDAIEAAIEAHVMVEGEATGMSGCEGGACSAEGEARAKVTTDCSVVASGAGRRGLGGLAVSLWLLAGALLVRRRTGRA